LSIYPQISRQFCQPKDAGFLAYIGAAAAITYIIAAASSRVDDYIAYDKKGFN
jgi:hypothetical protein